MADQRLQCLLEASKAGFTLRYDPLALRNRCFYRCVAKCFNLLEDDAIEATNEWLWNIDNSLLNGVIFLDLKKAFDTMHYELKTHENLVK